MEKKQNERRGILMLHINPAGKLVRPSHITKETHKVEGEELAHLLELVSFAASRTIEKAPRCGNSGRAEQEECASNLQAVPTTPGASAQLSPIAADLEGLAVSLGVLAGKVSPEEWEFLKMFRTNLRAAAERVAALENALEVPHA